jgi:replicative DNA helicase
MSGLDVQVIRHGLSRGGWDFLMEQGAQKLLSTTAGELLAAFGEYYRGTNLPNIQPEDFSRWFRVVHGASVPEVTQLAVDAMVGAASRAPDAPQLFDRLVEARRRKALAEALAAYDGGQDIALEDAVTAVFSTARKTSSYKQTLKPLAEILGGEAVQAGFTFRLGALNRAVKPLRPGDFIIVAAAVDSGKTSFCASEVTHMAAQVDTLYPNEGRSVLWLNNEGAEDGIIQRTFQAALNSTSEELVSRISSGTIAEDYRRALGGRAGVLRVFPIQGATTGKLEALFKQHPPAIIVFDMLDHVTLSGASADSKADAMEALYKWARDVGVAFNTVVIATSQLSIDGVKTATGAPVLYPDQQYLKDSRVGKQGAADVIIMVGRHTDPAFDSIRYIGTPKNKRKRTGVPGFLRAEVTFDADRAQFSDV